ncbi:uncharacterized protein [Gossypium hirsutum]|uniref:Uncharacterized protein isoform X3 n=1 Tax=Gossypium hirsutum TaxID=3635 RepID=A0A1U8LQZ3_GOSHI|nr:uncharacterized protein LOC107929033 isoform X3 [Gossypium hirsutum]
MKKLKISPFLLKHFWLIIDIFNLVKRSFLCCWFFGAVYPFFFIFSLSKLFPVLYSSSAGYVQLLHLCSYTICATGSNSIDFEKIRMVEKVMMMTMTMMMVMMTVNQTIQVVLK